MKHQVGLLLAAGAGVIGGKYIFEPRPAGQKEKAPPSSSTRMPSTTTTTTNTTSHHNHQSEHQPRDLSPPTLARQTGPVASYSPPEPSSTLSPSAIANIANTRTLACLPSTEISKSAHPDDAAKIMDEPLPSSPLIAKKIPSKEDSGEMQAEPYTKGPDTIGLFGRVKFW